MTRPSFEVAKVKGAIGEAVVRRILEAKGWVVYQPMTDGPHQFDMLSIRDKQAAIALDVKAKARMTYLPCTGVNQGHFEEYQRFSQRHRMPFWIVFVDESERAIYGNTIEELERPRVVGGRSYPLSMNDRRGKSLRLWPLSAMKRISDISGDDASELVALSQRSYDYREPSA